MQAPFISLANDSHGKIIGRVTISEELGNGGEVLRNRSFLRGSKRGEILADSRFQVFGCALDCRIHFLIFRFLQYGNGDTKFALRVSEHTEPLERRDL